MKEVRRVTTNRIAFILWGLCSISLAFRETGFLLVVPLAVGLIVLALMQRLSNITVRVGVAGVFIASVLLLPPLIWYLPILWFALFDVREPAAWLIPVASGGAFLALQTPPIDAAGILILCVLAALLRERDDRLLAVRTEYDTYFRDTREQQLKLLEANRSHAALQDQNTTIAVLNERNRIARDLHDGLGHIVSRGVLQIGALLVSESPGPRREQLESLQHTLNDGMEQLRQSLHQQMKEDIDLSEALHGLVHAFTACPVQLTVDLKTEKELNFKYSVLYIVREALHNIEKHSDATRAYISLRETHDSVYLLIRDNGHAKPDAPWGIGLISIQHRIESLGGTMEITADDGFRLFCTLRKERP